MKPDITIIVPIYNVEKYVAKCMDSLLRQTYKNFEVWAIDDGSPDNSKKIVEQYVKKDSRFRSILKENGGYGSVLEYGIQNINTKYFLVCDPDDWLEDTALEDLHNLAETNNLDIIVGDKYNIYTEKNSKKYVKSFQPLLKIRPRTVYHKREEIQRFAFGEVSPHAKLYKTKVAKNIEFPHKVSYTDTILYIMSIANASRVAYLNKPLANYLIDRPGNTMTAQTEAKIRNTIIIWNSMYKQLTTRFKVNDISSLIYFLYLEVKIILKTESKLPSKNYKDKSSEKVLKIVKTLQLYKNILSKYVNNKIPPYDTNSIIGRIFFKGFMNSKLYRQFVKMYIKIERKSNN
ncbi:glycosyltransferase-like protein [Lactobacillus amylovorus]|uniref:Glycosyltransferase-like protein n=1 Tax=Lactobacillus amylovorus TaxID=1604 RepID=F0TGX4_LACAM|nr:glycosyltransferase family 2 protein [Lactobacillus amylovorus]ADZ07968.1 glycosyltransferase-like protein [Lactobacillus amylovorus]